MADEEDGRLECRHRNLKRQGLQGVGLVTSDAHEVINQAVATALTGATWQRCRVQPRPRPATSGADGTRPQAPGRKPIGRRGQGATSCLYSNARPR